MTEQKIKRYLPKFHNRANPVGFISLHDALNQVGMMMDPNWGLDPTWKSHPFFIVDKKFTRLKFVKGKHLGVSFLFKKDAITRARTTAKTFNVGIKRLRTALETGALTSYVLGTAHAPIKIPKNSVAWVEQGMAIFSFGYMHHEVGTKTIRSRIVIKSDAFQSVASTLNKNIKKEARR